MTTLDVDDANPNSSSIDGVLFTKDGSRLLKYPDGKNDAEYVLPESVREIAVEILAQDWPPIEKAFCESDALTAIRVDDANPNFRSIDGVLFGKDGATLIRYPAGKKDGEYAVPNGVRKIAAGAFAGCVSLTKITLPPGLTYVDAQAFANCKSLKTLNFSKPQPRFIVGAFDGCDQLESKPATELKSSRPHPMNVFAI